MDITMMAEGKPVTVKAFDKNEVDGAMRAYTEATRAWAALDRAITMFEAQLRLYSQNQSTITPREGWEKPFYDTRGDLEALRGMAREQRKRAEEAKDVIVAAHRALPPL